jgi:hypothetical protein
MAGSHLLLRGYGILKIKENHVGVAARSLWKKMGRSGGDSELGALQPETARLIDS